MLLRSLRARTTSTKLADYHVDMPKLAKAKKEPSQINSKKTPSKSTTKASSVSKPTLEIDSDSSSEDDSQTKKATQISSRLRKRQVSNGIVGIEAIFRLLYKFEFSDEAVRYYNVLFFGVFVVFVVCYLILKQHEIITKTN
jgi:hypothetical protein